jgi:hypothetical protein
MIPLYFVGLFRCGDGRERPINDRLVLPKSFAAGRANSEMLLKPLLFLFGQLARGRNGAEF